MSSDNRSHTRPCTVPVAPVDVPDASPVEPGACGNRIVERVQRGAFSTSHHTRFSNAALTETDVDMTIDTARQAFPIVRKR